MWHSSEIRGNGTESGMLLFGEDEGKLALVDTIRVDLFMVETGGADKGVGREACEGVGT
jgi:hypothetical protein